MEGDRTTMLNALSAKKTAPLQPDVNYGGSARDGPILANESRWISWNLRCASATPSPTTMAARTILLIPTVENASPGDPG